MSDRLKGNVGPSPAGDNTEGPLRLTRDLTLVTQDGHAKYQEAVFRGNCYSVMTAAAGVTLAAANASLTAATAQPIVGFLNPVNSGVNCVIWEVVCGPQATGGSAANEGAYVYQYAPGSASTSISGTVPLSLKTMTAGGSRCIGSLNQAFTANAVTWIQLKPMVTNVSRFAAPTASINVNGIGKDMVDGVIVIPPGCAFGVFTLATGTAITVGASLTWEEIPV